MGYFKKITKTSRFTESVKQRHIQNQATRAYFISNGNKLRGRPKTTDISHRFNIQSDSGKDLAEITELAKDRKRWKGLAPQIDEATEESQTKNWDATRQ